MMKNGTITKPDDIFRCYNCNKEYGFDLMGGIILSHASKYSFEHELTHTYTRINFCSADCVKSHQIKMINRGWSDRLVDNLEKIIKWWKGKPLSSK